MVQEVTTPAPLDMEGSTSDDDNATSHLWASSSSQIGIVDIHMTLLPSGWSYHVTYDILVSFPDMHQEWVVRRTYQDFVDLHRHLLSTFHKKLTHRRITVPRQSRVEFHLSVEARYAQSAKRMRERLNAYLHRLLEIHDVHTSGVFRQFFVRRDSDFDVASTDPATSSPSGMSITKQVDAKELDVSPTSNESVCSTASTTTASQSYDLGPVVAGRDWQLHHALRLSDSSAKLTAQDMVAAATMHQARTPLDVLPPVASVAQVTSNCSSLVLYGSAVSIRTCGGLRVGLTKRSAWSGSQKMAAVAAGGAGMVLLSGPVGLTIAAIGSLGKHHLSKAHSMSVQPKDQVLHDEFLVESASPFSGAARPVHYGDPIRLVNVSKHQYAKVALPVDSKRGYVSLASSIAAASVFRWVSPLHYVGPIVCGSPVCLQVADDTTPWNNELLAVHKDFITTDGAPAVCHLVLHNHPCLANEDKSCTVSRPLPKPVVVRAMAYNVWFLPPWVSSLFNLSPFKVQRAHAIPAALPDDLDIVVFCEVFDAGAKIVLATEMKRRGFLYETRNAGARRGGFNAKAINSGVFAMSKYPLEHYDELLFGAAAAADDKVADKGAIYVQMKKRGEVIHVVGTHMQAWETDAAVAARDKQLKMLAAWVDSKKIPKRDAVVYAGDFNIDSASAEFDTMVTTLKATNPQTIAGTSEYSFDPFTNVLASTGKSSGGKQERLDYVMVGTEHRQPTSSWTQVIPLKVDHGWEDKALYDTIVTDLSDHFPVLSEFHFG
ncbi:hypothetical protein DYB32_006073 [Aphanomyces invadans]|uniref:sphingomyelin phosphodiesterase n=1 Tax=Aphanomyces invadans TaxID=157072 RepID=A0A3R6ZNM5_9STRA|nr:hypothetical protein DYB32_006073 [Aphanomyces invadans]